MTLKETYAQLHGDYEEAVQRMMNDSLVTRFILKFPNDPSMDQLRQAVEQNDCQAAFTAAHTLKGVAANLSFTELFRNADALVEQLRENATAIDMEMYCKVLESYELVISTLNAFKS